MLKVLLFSMLMALAAAFRAAAQKSFHTRWVAPTNQRPSADSLHSQSLVTTARVRRQSLSVNLIATSLSAIDDETAASVGSCSRCSCANCRCSAPCACSSNSSTCLCCTPSSTSSPPPSKASSSGLKKGRASACGCTSLTRCATHRLAAE